jgi:hypothetical protein
MEMATSPCPRPPRGRLALHPHALVSFRPRIAVGRVRLRRPAESSNSFRKLHLASFIKLI